jgi:hypothetical protein
VVNFDIEVSKEELALIEDIRHLRYGEIYDVEVPESKGSKTHVRVTKQTKNLIDVIREGYRHFVMIQVHQSEPAYAETPGETKLLGFRCRKRHKFS